MHQFHAAGRGFAADRHGLSDTSPFVFAATDIPDSGAAFPLIIVADLVEPVPGATDIVEDVLLGMAQFLTHTPPDAPRATLVQAFATANARVLAENSKRSGMRRLHIGLTCVVMRQDEVFVAQCAPGQLLVWQAGDLHAIPRLASWSARDITGTFSALSYPLGFRRELQPRIAYSRCAQGDVIAVLSWQLARHLHDTGTLRADSHPSALTRALSELNLPTGAMRFHGAIFKVRPAAANISGDTTKLGIDEWWQTSESKSTSKLNVESRTHGSYPAHAGPSRSSQELGGRGASRFDTLGAGHSRDGVTEDLPIVRSRTNGAAYDATFVEFGASAVRFAEPGAPQRRPDTPGSENRHNYGIAAAPPDRNGRPPAREGHIVEIFAGLLLSLSAAVVGVWQVTKRDRPIHGPRDDGTLGLPHLQRWSDSYQRPRFDQVRRVSPRFQINGFLLMGAIIAVVALAGVLAFNALSSRTDGQVAGLEDRLQSISAVRMQIDTSNPSGSSFESLLGAQVALEELEGSTSSDDLRERIQEEQAAVATAIEEIASVQRLSTIQVLGSLPPAADGVTPRLFKGGERAFVLGGAFYELDQISGTLIQLLAPGDLVNGEPVGALLAAAWNDDRPLVVDAFSAYLKDPSDGRWHRVPLGVLSDTGYTSITALSAFSRNLYYLTADSGQILKFDALDFSAAPEDWAAGSAREVLQDSTDLLVDGRIHAVTRDGQVITFFRSAHEATISPKVLPPLQSVTALTLIADGLYYFVIDSEDGRIVGFGTDGELYRQFVTGPGLQTLAGATDLIINESNGITHILANDTLYMVRLTLPGR